MKLQQGKLEVKKPFRCAVRDRTLEWCDGGGEEVGNRCAPQKDVSIKAKETTCKFNWIKAQILAVEEKDKLILHLRIDKKNLCIHDIYFTPLLCSSNSEWKRHKLKYKYTDFYLNPLKCQPDALELLNECVQRWNTIWKTGGEHIASAPSSDRCFEERFFFWADQQKSLRA